jgi:hypothetical protein
MARRLLKPAEYPGAFDEVDKKVVVNETTIESKR